MTCRPPPAGFHSCRRCDTRRSCFSPRLSPCWHGLQGIPCIHLHPFGLFFQDCISSRHDSARCLISCGLFRMHYIRDVPFRWYCDPLGKKGTHDCLDQACTILFHTRDIDPLSLLFQPDIQCTFLHLSCLLCHLLFLKQKLISIIIKSIQILF